MDDEKTNGARGGLVGSDSYFTARAGKVSPTLVRNHGNGLLASASTPLIITDTVLGQNPFTPSAGA